MLHEAGRVELSQAQPETAAAARGRRREYPVLLPSLASGSCLASWRLILGIANCRMITTLCPLEAVARSRRSPAVLTVNQRRRTINCCCVKIARTLPSFIRRSLRLLFVKVSRIGEFDCQDTAPTHPRRGRQVDQRSRSPILLFASTTSRVVIRGGGPHDLEEQCNIVSIAGYPCFRAKARSRVQIRRIYVSKK